MIKQANRNYDAPELERKIQEFWEKAKVYEKTKEYRNDGEYFYFIDGPPYTTGSIHLGTAWNKAIKDTYIRYFRMKGLNVRDQAGYDMHGLPIEVKVERSLGIKNKKEIEELGIEKFINTCREFALEYQKKMTEQFKSLGVWLDWENPYITIENDYIESTWWTLKKAYEKGLLSRSERVLPWCPRCETALAEAEIDYWDEEDPSIYVKFPVKNKSNEFILVWTTTPWTLPANLAAAVHPDYSYARVKAKHGSVIEVYILLESTVDEVMKATDIESYRILESIPGDALVGMEYLHPLMTEVSYQRGVRGSWVHRVISSEIVEKENTGVVHIAPGHGPEDFEIGKEFGLPAFCPVEEDGTFTSSFENKYAKLHVKDANILILRDLKKKELLFAEGTVTHRYGHCWRCNIGIIYRTTNQWFLRASQVKERMLDLIDEIQWTPEWAGSSRQYDWVEGARDWCISRQRYWGTPMPVWTCQCGEMRIIDSKEALKEAENYKEDDIKDLHRPWIDRLEFKCEKCGGRMKRVPDVMDVWMDSAVCSWAQLHYPAEKKEFEKWWPCNWITEAHDQTRGWFYSQLVASTICFDLQPYNSVLMHGWVLDEKGQRMSKSVGNIVEPHEVTEKFGADALRFYLLKASAPWEDLPFHMEGVKIAHRTMNILWNVYYFGTTYMALDSFDWEDVSFESLAKGVRKEDRWILSRLENLKAEFQKEMDAYNMHKALRTAEHFILEDLSRWYIKLVRGRTWTEGEDKDKLAVYKTLHETLLTLSELLAPVVPHVAESLYQNLDGELLSVHMCDFPEKHPERIDGELEKNMKIIMNIVEAGSKARQKAKRKLRWPIKRIIIDSKNEDVVEAVRDLKELLLSQLNCKAVEVVEPAEEWSEMLFEVRPNPKAIGKVYRQWASRIAVMLKNQSATKIKKEIERGEYHVGIEGQLIKIERNMVEFTQKLPENIYDAEFDGGFIYVDSEITDDIRKEGYMREVIRRIQEMRKEMDMDVEDFIAAKVGLSEDLLEDISEFKDYIAKETRSRTLDFVESDKVDGELIIEWTIEGEQVLIGITPLYIKEVIDSFSKIPGISKELALRIFDTGITSMELLETTPKEALLKIPEVKKSTVRKIRNFFEKMEERGPEEDEQICALCGAAVDMEAKECKRCGTPFVVEEELPAPEEGDEVPAPAPPAEVPAPAALAPAPSPAAAAPATAAAVAAPPVSAGELRCDVCGAKVSPGDSACPICDSEVSLPPESAPAEAPAPSGPVAQGLVPCHICDEMVEPAEKCSVCGARLRRPAPPSRPAEAQVAPAAPMQAMAPPEAAAPPLPVPAPVPAPPPKEEIPELKRGYTYLVEEERSKKSYLLLTSCLEKGSPGFCVTRNYPDKIRSQFGLPEEVPILWLSNVGKKDSVRPKDLEKLSLNLEQFLSKNTHGVILLDGLEYLITNNNFITVLRLIQSLRDQVAINQSIFLLSVNPSTLEKHQINLLEREVDASIM